MMGSSVLLSFVFFEANDLVSPIKDPVGFPVAIMNLDPTFSCYLMSVMTLKKFVFRNYR